MIIYLFAKKYQNYPSFDRILNFDTFREPKIQYITNDSTAATADSS